ncbi:MAG: 30S ribosomal protein S9 [Proteobacteria bacterium]|nr:MAG: 30S ribosomal protein S9 [Pseudomonadota bacterium]PIE17252.1 MAG: 30S ribosomal protein S9 [Pseudomonadota bacterium]
MSETQHFYGTGRRKSSVARVYITPGSGQILINGRTLDEYFPRYAHRANVMFPLEQVEHEDKIDVKVNVRGGGQTGQAGAIRHGISRALLQFNPEMRGPLKKAGFLTRDARVKERKKYGQPGARKNYQFSKR